MKIEKKIVRKEKEKDKKIKKIIKLFSCLDVMKKLR